MHKGMKPTQQIFIIFLLVYRFTTHYETVSVL